MPPTVITFVSKLVLVLSIHLVKSQLNLRLGIAVIQLDSSNAKPPDRVPPREVDFETAMSETGFGRFNVFVVLTCAVSCVSSMGQTTNMSMIFPRAHCDLQLSLADKGALNAATYVGMIMSAIMWGFLADVKGRQKILCYGNLAVFVVDLFTGLSQNFWSLAFAKFCGGFM